MSSKNNRNSPSWVNDTFGRVPPLFETNQVGVAQLVQNGHLAQTDSAETLVLSEGLEPFDCVVPALLVHHPEHLAVGALSQQFQDRELVALSCGFFSIFRNRTYLNLT